MTSIKQKNQLPVNNYYVKPVHISNMQDLKHPINPTSISASLGSSSSSELSGLPPPSGLHHHFWSGALLLLLYHFSSFLNWRLNPLTTTHGPIKDFGAGVDQNSLVTRFTHKLSNIKQGLIFLQAPLLVSVRHIFLCPIRHIFLCLMGHRYLYLIN